MLALTQGFLLSAQRFVFALDLVKCHSGAQDQENDQGHKQPRDNTGHVDPDIGHRRGAVGDRELDGLVHEGGAHTSQQRPADVADKTPCVDPQAEHQQETLEHELGEMRQLADDMFRQGAKAELAQKAVDHGGDGLAAGGRDFARLHGVAEDKEDTGQQRRRKENAERDQPWGCFLLLHSAPFMWGLLF